MVFRFRMLSDENDNFIRDYEVLEDSTLLEFHKFLIESLEYEDCISSFFTADSRWEKLAEFTMMDMGDSSQGAPMPMDKVTLGEIIKRDKARLIYLFDPFGDRAYYLELSCVFAEAASAFYPCEVYEQADVPDQYRASEGGQNEGSIFDEMMGDFGDFEGDEGYNEE